MTSQVCVIPVKCHQCGKVFDLRHDPAYLEGENIIEILRERVKGTFVCWRCRDK